MHKRYEHNCTYVKSSLADGPALWGRAISSVMESDDDRTAIRDLVQRMMDENGLDATTLARRAGLAHTTLTRFLNQPVKHMLSARTLAKLSRASGVPVPAGSPLSAPSERELLAAFRSTDDQGREMILRLSRSLRRDAESKPDADPELPAARDRIGVAGCVVPARHLKRGGGD